MSRKAEDISAIRGLEKQWCRAWNAHDMRELASLLTRDADFVTVGGDWFQGRKEFRKWHEMLHRTMFKESTFTVTEVNVKIIRPDLALSHVKWRIQGDLDPDGTARKPRTGIFTRLVRKSKDGWKILASQNTNEAHPSSGAFAKVLESRVWK